MWLYAIAEDSAGGGCGQLGGAFVIGFGALGVAGADSGHEYERDGGEQRSHGARHRRSV